MARTSQFAKMRKKLNFNKLRQRNRCRFAAARAAFCASSRCAASASAVTPCSAKFPAW